MTAYWLSVAFATVILYVASWGRWSNPPKLYPEWGWGLAVSITAILALVRHPPQRIAARTMLPRCLALVLLAIAAALNVLSIVRDYLCFGLYHH